MLCGLGHGPDSLVVRDRAESGERRSDANAIRLDADIWDMAEDVAEGIDRG